jgi:hypothetical protein
MSSNNFDRIMRKHLSPQIIACKHPTSDKKQPAAEVTELHRERTAHHVGAPGSIRYGNEDSYEAIAMILPI